MGLIDDLLTKANFKIGDVTEIAVNRGPGSFTGLRVGLSVGAGLSLTSKTFLGVTGFQIYRAQSILDKPLFAVIDSRREELFCAYFPKGAWAAKETIISTKADILKEISAFQNAAFFTNIEDFGHSFSYIPFSASRLIGALPNLKMQGLDFDGSPYYMRPPDVGRH